MHVQRAASSSPNIKQCTVSDDRKQVVIRYDGDDFKVAADFAKTVTKLGFPSSVLACTPGGTAAPPPTASAGIYSDSITHLNAGISILACWIGITTIVINGLFRHGWYGRYVCGYGTQGIR